MMSLALRPDRCAGLDCGAQHLAGGELHDAVLVDQPLRLGAFAGSRRTEQYQPHCASPPRPGPIRDLRIELLSRLGARPADLSINVQAVHTMIMNDVPPK